MSITGQIYLYERFSRQKLSKEKTKSKELPPNGSGFQIIDLLFQGAKTPTIEIKNFWDIIFQCFLANILYLSLIYVHKINLYNTETALEKKNYFPQQMKIYQCNYEVSCTLVYIYPEFV